VNGSHPEGGAGRGALARLLAPVERVTAALARAGIVIGAVLTLAMTVVVAYSVVMRYLFNRPQTWTDELVAYWMVLLVVLGAAEVLRRDSHVSVDLLTSRLGPAGRRAVEIWSLAAILVTALVLLVSSWQMVAFSSRVGLFSEGYLEVPMWIPQSSMLVGMALLILAALNRLLRLLARLD
jgi:C4-dicarboxylate transporter DctQ subunit